VVLFFVGVDDVEATLARAEELGEGSSSRLSTCPA
jgi:hypothetical protein